MAKNNGKMVEAITSMDEDFAKWYTDICKKAELVEYTSVKGCMVIRPYGYAIWENIQRILDTMFKERGHENVCMPMFIPESLLQKEKDHVEGFAPEVAWVTHGGSEKLEDRLCVRPTSETLFCEHYANIVHSYRDLPKLYNQWVSVVRWEKTTRPFLRSREFLWQEGHTIHETADEAIWETERMLDCYAEFCEKSLCMPVVKGRKTDSDKFAGAEATYAIEALMHDGKALQAGTSHYFGDGFARAFGIQYTSRENKLEYPHQTSWGVTTRLIGAIIMTHGDDNGLVLPPAVAPVQVVIVPIAQKKEGVLDKATELYEKLKACGLRVKLDDSDNSPGWKFAEYEMRGVPVRVEIGPKDIENGQCVVATRFNGEKAVVSLENNLETFKDTVIDLIENVVPEGMFNKALENRKNKTYQCKTMDEIIKALEEKGDGFIEAMWCGEEECEDKVKEVTGVGSRCIPNEQHELSDVCVCCGKPAKKMVLWGKAY
ncbi:MAG: proline--tRNA ligase [Oscillospiraceae bacterium]|nr:proline--tRNA ligase [Oscillospiraceae bacterium]MBQ8883130.1 proline--tRNA ligase [Oscillospiraceae bacterium]